MSENVINLRVYRAFQAANNAEREILEEVEEGIFELSTVNLMELKPRARQIAFKRMANWKIIRLICSEPFRRFVESKRFAEGMSKEEMLALAKEFDPKAFDVQLV